MALHDQAVEAEEDRAIVIVRIEMDLEQVERRPRQREAGLRPKRAREGAAQQVGDEARRALGGLERDVARKAVGDDHIDLAARQLVALGEAVEAERQIVGVAQQRRGFLELVGALQFLGADVEQLHARLGEAEHAARIGRAHDRELDEVLRIALGVGAEVEHDDVGVAERRQQARRAPAGRCPASSAARAWTSPSARRCCRPTARRRPSPSFTALIAMPIEVVRARRIAWLGFSLAAIASGEWTTRDALARFAVAAASSASTCRFVTVEGEAAASGPCVSARDGAGDHRRRAAVAAHRVDCDAWAPVHARPRRLA